MLKRHLFLLFAFCLLWPFRPANAQQTPASPRKPHLVIVIAESEYKTSETVPPFAKANLQQDFRITLLEPAKENGNFIPGLDVVSTADVLFLSLRRRPLPPDQLRVIREYVARGKPVVGIRTASHAFCLRNKNAPDGLADWPEFDHDILGGNYSNHHGNKVKTYVKTSESDKRHPILLGISENEFRVFGSLYQCQPLADSATLLMTGRAEGIPLPEPVAWTNKPKNDNRVFYTSLGHPQDFTIPTFVRLLRNGTYWAAGLAIPKTEAVTLKRPPQK